MTTAYLPGAQTTNSQPNPVYTFRVNLETVNKFSWDLPNRTTLDGNETVVEADNMKNTRTTWLTNLFPGTSYLVHHDGDTITAYGSRAIYLNNTYATGDPNAVLVRLT